VTLTILILIYLFAVCLALSLLYRPLRNSSVIHAVIGSIIVLLIVPFSFCYWSILYFENEVFIHDIIISHLGCQKTRILNSFGFSISSHWGIIVNKKERLRTNQVLEIILRGTKENDYNRQNQMC